MQDIITTIAAQYVAEMIVASAASALGLAGTFVLAQLGCLIGERRMVVLNEKLGGAIERAKADAESRGLNGDSLTAWVAASIKQTMAGTIRKLKATDSDLARRIAGQVAQTAPDLLAGALKKASIPVLDAVR